MVDSKAEIRAGDRRANWSEFVELVDAERIEVAVQSLQQALGVASLAGKSFLDIGCGSGLFSLAADRLGARVRSFDFDTDSVTATATLRERFAPTSDWVIDAGSVLDPAYMSGLGRYDVVYSCVLHHTGHLWPALATAADRVAVGGDLFISIDNDQGAASRQWRRVKRRYNRSGRVGRFLLIGLSALYLHRNRPLWALIRALRPGRRPARPAPRARGMSRWHDLVDWVGRYPFEVARPEEIFRFVHHRGFELRYLTTCGGEPGCNEYVFRRMADSSGPGSTGPAPHQPAPHQPAPGPP